MRRTLTLSLARSTGLVVAALVAGVVFPTGLEGQDPSSLPEIQQLELSNGLRVMLVETHAVPLVQVNLVVRVGAAHDPADRLGLARMVADLMVEGAAGIASIESFGASINVSSAMHTTTVGLFTPADQWRSTVPLMANIALRPDFASADLDSKKISRLSDLREAHEDGQAIARTLFARALFGEVHPYGRSTLSTEAAIGMITTNDLRTIHTTYFRTNNSVLIVVGAVTAEDVTATLENAFGSWEARPVPEARWPETDQVGEREVLLVDRPGAAQSEIVIGRISTARATDDALEVMNAMLGGTFESRLNQNLRELHGYASSVGSGFEYALLSSAFRVSATANTDSTALALREMFHEFARMHESLPEDELHRARRHVAYRYPSRLHSVRGIAEGVQDRWLYDLPFDGMNGYVDRVLAVSGNDVERVAREHIVPDRMIVVVVGDRATIEDEIRLLDLGLIRHVSIEEVLDRR